MNTNFNFPRVIAHRGASAYAPENTLIAMQKAHELGAKCVEFDVMLTQDEQAIIMHDETLNRTTNGKGEVAKTTWSQIEKLDAGSWFEKKFAGTKVPSFVELLNCLHKLGMQMNVEIKPTPGKEIITAQRTIEILEKHWPITKSMPLISSWREESLHTVYEINPGLPLGFISDDWLENWAEKLDMLHCVSLNVNHEVLDAAKVAAVKSAGYYVLAYTVNSVRRAKELFSWGVDGIFTNYPDKMLVVQSRGF